MRKTVRMAVVPIFGQTGVQTTSLLDAVDPRIFPTRQLLARHL